ncbi:uncharacterized protein LOC119187112 isoform X1 [Rhipicephalus microplus]|uniref:uncharacterized protein LOC119187112 isoform X1 n=1 Tax=Rhipicephalus microplus TaxID=6941 RepID=UPI003F6C7912
METPHLPSPDDCNVIGEAEPTVGLFVHQDADELCKSGAPLVQHTEERDENLDLGLSERHCDEEAPSLDSSSLGNAGRVLENVNNPMNGVEEFAVCQDKHETVSSECFAAGQLLTWKCSSTWGLAGVNIKRLCAVVGLLCFEVCVSSLLSAHVHLCQHPPVPNSTASPSVWWRIVNFSYARVSESHNKLEQV